MSEIIGGAHVDTVVIDGGDAPEVAADDVAAQLGGTCGVAAINADTAASIHRVFFQIVVDELVVLNEGEDVGALLGIAVAVVFYDVVADDGLRRADVHQVGNGDAA